MQESYRRAAPTVSIPAAVAAGVGVMILFVGVLAVLKMAGVIAASWTVVAAPLWLPFVGVWSVFVVALIGAVLLYPYKAARR